MKTCSYDELYLPLAQRTLGDMFDYAVHTLNYSLGSFYKMFIVSGFAHQFEIGNPTYIAGMNGCEVAREVVAACGLPYPSNEDIMYVDKSTEYWTGWAIAFYQWSTNIKYAEIDACVPIEEICCMYHVYHEMDISAFVETLNDRVKENMEKSRLQRLRKYASLSQSQLAKKADVPLRQIQLFEQGQRDINKTQGETLDKLAKVLNCSMESLIQR